MAEHDFDLVTLADHLHVAVEKVARLAERGQIPGRRVNNEWRFSAAEIHHWLEERIGGSNPEELADLEEILRGRRSQQAAARIAIGDLLPLAAIEPNLAARTRTAVFPALVDVAARTGLVWDQEKLVEALKAREELQSTAMDNGVALMHARRPQVSILGDALIAIGRTPTGIPFGNARGKLTDIFILLCMTDDRTHLRVLARWGRLLAEPDFVSALREAADPRAIWELVQTTEERLQITEDPPA